MDKYISTKPTNNNQNNTTLNKGDCDMAVLAKPSNIITSLYSVPDAIEFYKKNRFEFLNEYMIPIKHIESEDCTPMYLRLLK